MPVERFFDDHLEPSHKEGKLVEDEMHHATRVFRLKENDSCEVINGRGLLAQVIIKEITKKHVLYEVTNQTTHQKTGLFKTLVLGMPKFTKLELIAEKICELGCDELVLFNADKSEKFDLSENQMERLHTIFGASLKQSGRLFCPSVQFRSHLKDCFIFDKTYFFGQIDTTKKFPVNHDKDMGFVIGPESGFSDSEIQMLKEKATGISLSDAVLRCETAAISAAFLMSYL